MESINKFFTELKILDVRHLIWHTLYKAPCDKIIKAISRIIENEGKKDLKKQWSTYQCNCFKIYLKKQWWNLKQMKLKLKWNLVAVVNGWGAGCLLISKFLSPA